MEILIETAANSATKLTTGLTGGPCQLRPVVGPSRLRTIGRYEMKPFGVHTGGRGKGSGMGGGRGGSGSKGGFINGEHTKE